MIRQALKTLNNMASSPERFLPVEPLVRRLVQESYPDLNTNPGSAIHDVFVLPASVIYQRFRDTARVIHRNQSVDNFNLMLPEELDRLAGNFLVSRRQGTNATGTQRIYFRDLQSVTVDTSATFRAITGQVYRPTTAIRLTPVELAANRNDAGEYYVDVPIVSEGTGSEFRAAPGTINQVIGVVGAARTDNLAELAGGDDQESNSELAQRIRTSVTNRELVKRDGIISTIQDSFSTVKNVLVQGYGDPAQDRDVVSVAANLDRVLPVSFGQKVNLPLDSDGNVYFSSDANQNLAPTGGFVGALYDLTGRDFGSIEVSLDGRTSTRVAIQPGYQVRFTDPNDPDFDNNDFIITRIETVPVEPEGEPVKILRLNRPLLGTENVGSVIDTTPYSVYGSYFTNDFHVGGKVDVYIDSTNATSRDVIVSAVPSVAAGTDVGEIPLVETATDGLGNSLFENNTGFLSPVIAITKVELIDAVSDEQVLMELIPGTHYSVVRADMRGRFTETENDMLVVRGSENPIDPLTNQPSEVSVPLFIGQRLRVTYVTNPDINTIQEFVDSSSQRDVTKDILVKPPALLPVDVEIRCSGSASVTDIQTIISNYINQLGFGEALMASDLVTILTHFGVSSVQLPISLKARRETGDGSTRFLEANDQLTPDTIERFLAGTIDVTIL